MPPFVGVVLRRLREEAEDRVEIPDETAADGRVIPAARGVADHAAHLHAVECSELIREPEAAENLPGFVLDRNRGLLDLGERDIATRLVVDRDEDRDLVDFRRNPRRVNRDHFIDALGPTVALVAGVKQSPTRRTKRTVGIALQSAAHRVQVENAEHLFERIDLGAAAVIDAQQRIGIEIVGRIPGQLGHELPTLRQVEGQLHPRNPILLQRQGQLTHDCFSISASRHRTCSP